MSQACTSFSRYVTDIVPVQQVKARAMERALLQEDCECGQMEAGRHVHKPEWVCLADDANEATRLLNVKCTRGWLPCIASMVSFGFVYGFL